MAANNVALYFRERFPLGGVAFISFSFALLAFCIKEITFSQKWFLTIIFLSIVFAAFLLRQRVTDEFKDKHHDDIFFLNRPFQRGLVTAKELVVLGTIAFVIEIAAVFLVGGITSFIWYLPILTYSALMAKEFFTSKWLDKHFTTYFLIHEVIFVFFAIWIAKVVDAQFNLALLAWVIAFTCIMISIEVGRKFELRKGSKGKVVKDTYSAVWGRSNTIDILTLLMMTAGIALSYSESSIIFALISAVTSLVLNVFTMRDNTIKISIVVHVLFLIVAGLII